MNPAQTSRTTASKVLYVVVCGAPPTSEVHEFVTAAQAQGWDVCVVATPEATKFVDLSQLEALTTHPVRTEYRSPGQQDPWPGPDAIAVVPATFNTINKWAQGIADTLAVGMLCEHMGRGIPIMAVPCLKDDLAKHPAFPSNMRVLERCGVRFLYEPEKYAAPTIPPWNEILTELAGIQPGSSMATRGRMSESQS